MGDPIPSTLTAWSTFYVLMGSSAASLTGLMFVVITLVTGADRRGTRAGFSTFSTPTIVHFGAALLVAGVLTAPWRSLAHVAGVIGLASLFGLGYTVRMYLRQWRHHSSYTPDLEDWICYTILPFVAYGALLGGAIALVVSPVDAMFALASGVVLSIFIGIHNAWDIVTFIAVGGIDDPPHSEPKDPPAVTSAPPAP
jgi:hypothetical protein